MSKYAIRIVDDTLDLIEVLSPWGRPVVKETNTYFLFTVDPPTTTKDHDIVEEADLGIYDGDNQDIRIVL